MDDLCASRRGVFLTATLQFCRNFPPRVFDVIDQRGALYLPAWSPFIFQRAMKRHWLGSPTYVRIDSYRKRVQFRKHVHSESGRVR